MSGDIEMPLRTIMLIFVFLAVLCATTSGTSVECNFKCKSNDDHSTMMHYSYLKEPKLQENGYTRGYKAGSLNYFYNGDITFNDTMYYVDGLNTTGGNSSVYHEQDVDFTGEKGISEFYAKGFYRSNRAISAWKKIRYYDYNYTYGEGPDKSTKYIKVRARAGMGGPGRRMPQPYDVEYNATVENMVVEIWDATGWTNKTGSRRVDWEQTALMEGSLTVVNDLEGKGLFFPGAGGNDEWLPCCFDGTHPPIANRDKTNEVKPPKILPSKELNRTWNQTLFLNETTGVYEYKITVKKELVDLPCTEGDCPGYECIYKYAVGEGEEEEKPKEKLAEPQVSGITIAKTLVDERGMPRRTDKTVRNGDIARFLIAVSSNIQEPPLSEIKVTEIVPLGLNFRNESTLEYGDDSLGSIYPKVGPKSGNNQTFIWDLPENVLVNSTKSAFIFVNFDVSLGGADNITLTNVARAEGKYGNDTAKPAEDGANIILVKS